MSRLIAHEARVLLRHPWGWIASGFGCGLAPFAPGTVGSAVAAMGFWILGASVWPLWVNLLLVAAGFALGVLASDWVCRALATEDASVIVIDEWVGQWLTLCVGAIYWPLQRGSLWDIGFFASAFVFFRIADILKPWPANLADRNLAGGFGAMLDDLIAAVYSAAAVALLGYVLT